MNRELVRRTEEFLKDRFDVYRIYESLEYEKFGALPLEEKRERAEQRLRRLRELTEYPMATDTARELWRERIGFNIRFYEKLSDQLRASEELI